MIENPEKVAARKAFLMSSVPDVLRASAAAGGDGGGGGDGASPSAGFPPLPRVSHVRQDGEDGSGGDPFWRLQCVTIEPLSLRSPQPPRHRSLDVLPKLGFGQFSRLLKSHLDAAREGGPGLGLGGGTPKPGQLLRRLAPPEVYGIAMKMIEGDDGEAKCKDTFSPRRVFKSFLKRKLESDALEAEARSKNLVRALKIIRKS